MRNVNIEQTMTGFGWKVDGAVAHKQWKFSNFIQAHGFVQRIAELAEAQNHHPDIAHGWGYVRLSVTTHDEKALTQKDVALVSEIEKIA